MPEDRLGLHGRVAIVTGGTRGIGLACARRLRARGARLVITGRNVADGDAAARSLDAHFVACEAADPETPGRIRAMAEQAFGRVDILVNTAGGLGAARGVADTTTETLDATLAVHLRAPWLLMTEVVALMPPGASIVNIASIAGHRVGASSAAYAVAKAALIHLTRCAAAEFGARGVRVNSVSPGFVPTGIHAQALPAGDDRGAWLVESLERVFRQRQAVDRTGMPEDVAEIVAFLASEAANFITGSDIVADGGTIWGRAGLM